MRPGRNMRRLGTVRNPEQNFIRYDGSGEVPSQIHSYLSTNFKELRSLAKDDGNLRAKAKDRWYVPDPNKAGDLEKLRERAFFASFGSIFLPAINRTNRIELEGSYFRVSAPAGANPKGKKIRKLSAWRRSRPGSSTAGRTETIRTIIAVAGGSPKTWPQEDPKLLMWYDQAVTRVGEE